MAGSRRIRAAVAILLGAALALVAGGACAFASAAPDSLRVGHAPALPRGARTLAPLAAGRQLQLTVALKSQDPAGLDGFAEAVSTPASPLFRRYVGVAEFAQRFGATDQQIALVRSQLGAQGLAVGQPAANGLSLPIRASAAQVEHAFSLSLAQVELANGRSAYANAQAPSIAAAIAPYVQGVIGLDDVALDQPQGLEGPLRATASPARPAASSAEPSAAPLASDGPEPCPAARKVTEELGGETADEIATAYQLQGLYQAGDLGAGQTIALFEQEAYEPFDVETYQACYGTHTSITNVNVDGGPPPSEGSDLESALDIEQIIGLAPQAHLLVYQGPIEQKVAPIDILSRIVSDDSAKVISSSYGLCEAFTFAAGAGVIQFENTLLQEAAAQGQSFFAASGDSGSEQCEQDEPEDTELSVNNPASQPFATGVGGTSLFSRDGAEELRYDGTLPPVEGVWNDGKHSEGLGGSGGGLSEVWTMPGYQSGSGMLGVLGPESSADPCGRSALCREAPDVAASADPNKGYVVHVGGEEHGSWTLVGGTSAAAPLWAALTGLADASSACAGVPIGFANPALYEIAASNYAGNFRDVVEPSPATGRANNDTTFGVGPFAVSIGYDMATGLGAPLGSALAASLCAIATRPASAPPAVTPATPLPAIPPATPSPAPVATISSAQIRARLLAEIIPSLKAARIASLLKRAGFSLSFAAPEPGTLAIGWYAVPRGAKLARAGKPKPVLVASGRVSFTAAGRRTIRLSPTRAGRVLLRRAKQLRLTAKGTFTPRGKSPISATRSFLLRR